MLAENLVQKFPFISNYFFFFLENNVQKFPQSIVFEGLDSYAQCFFALELARVLNCLQDGRQDCNCLNCRWIRENKHPAISFVSQLHYKNSGDDSKTVISVPQVKNIEKSLKEKSDYHRFFIFFDARQTPQDKNAIESVEKYSPEGYNIFPENDWCLNHINSKTFSPLTPNILLKCVEEPPERTTFVFLTKNRADLISTIVSRSQCFKLPVATKKADISDIANIFSKYPDISYEDAFLISENLQNYIKDNETNADFVLDSMLAYLTNKLKIVNNNELLYKIQNDIEYVSQAKKYSAASILDKNVFDTLLLRLAGGEK